MITYNRPQFLQETLASITKSNFKEFRLLVIDNGGTDPTAVQSVVDRASIDFPIELVRFDKNQTGETYPFFYAILESESELMMVFHDDDLIHPDYISVALSKLLTFNTVSLVCAYGRATPAPRYSELLNTEISNGELIAKDLKSLVRECITVNRGIFGSTVYRRRNLVNIPHDRLQRFGKIQDRPIWCEALGNGTAVFLEGEYVLYRTHPGQDTSASTSGPFPEECIALLEYYKSILGSSLREDSGRLFNLSQSSFLREMWKWPGIRSRISFFKFVVKAFMMGAATPLVFVPRFLMRFLRKRIFWSKAHGRTSPAEW